MQPPAKLKIEIRHFTERDYDVFASVRQRVMPEYPMTASELRFYDQQLPEKCKSERFFACVRREIVAFGDYHQSPFAYHPQKFDVGVFVLPEFQSKGIGTELYEYVAQKLQPFDPITLRSFAREDYQQSLRFLAKRGFHETMRAWESRLDIKSFDFSRYAGHVGKVEASGIKIIPLSQIPRTPERDRKLYELDLILSEDVPHPDPFTPLEYENFLERFIENPGFFPEAYQIAMDGDEYIGMSNLWKSQANRDLQNGLTGVKREYRRKGIALAMKLKNLQVVKEQGYPLIKTWNESNNRGMLSINEEMGFVKQPSWISFAKDLPASGPP
ncbi:GNAT family N-acetyltransferase [Candidatus Acetothermia bacterium]|nr:GNAT family N-acetyltransferase [Candidatus Acetothermia bacterium]MBI3644204.1 GNAT family N-acetyltransferase [Candidatus Acetothermia bacterium]